jgi:hypothetical protein
MLTNEELTDVILSGMDCVNTQAFREHIVRVLTEHRKESNTTLLIVKHDPRVQGLRDAGHLPSEPPVRGTADPSTPGSVSSP